MISQPKGDDALVGTVIAQRYEVVRLIAKGGMGAIYEVRHLKLGRTFVLKRLLASASSPSEALARFRREAEVVAGFRHPHIVEIVDWELLDDGTPCMVMEHLRGEDLAARIARFGPLGWPFIARVGDQICSALAAAHRAGIVHRDLKPQNVFLALDDTGEERVKLLDFGVSKIRDSSSTLTTDAVILGTPAYMAPEQAEGRSELISPATDAWATGAILFEMATGKVPFPSETTMSMLFRICHGSPEALRPLRPDAPPAFVTLMEQVLSRGADRIATIDALKRRLADALAPRLSGAALHDEGRSPTLPEEPTRLLSGPPPAVSATQPRAALPQAKPQVEPHATARGRPSAAGALPTVVKPVPVDPPRAPAPAPRITLDGRQWALAGIAVGAIVASSLVIMTRLASSPRPIPASPLPPDQRTANVTVSAAPQAERSSPEEASADPVVAAPAPRPTPTPESTTVDVRIERAPAHAKVWVDELEVIGDHLTLSTERPVHALRASAVGFVEERRTFRPQTERTLRIGLRPRAPARPSKPPQPSGPVLLDP